MHTAFFTEVLLTTTDHVNEYVITFIFPFFDLSQNLFHKARRRSLVTTRRILRMIEDKGKVCHTTFPENTMGSRHIAFYSQAQS
jgi:hypothetical protein